MMTGRKGVFAGGDMAPSERTVTVAVGHGKKAARCVDAYLRGETYTPAAKHGPASFERLNAWYYEDAPPTVRPMIQAARRIENFEEVQGGLDETNALYEARRCLSCGNCFECDNCYGVCPDNAVIKLGPGKRFQFNLRLLQGLRAVRGGMSVRGDRHGGGGDLGGAYGDIATPPPPYFAIPKNTASRRSTSSTASASNRPKASPILVRITVIALSIMICAGWRRPLVASGATVTRSSGASTKALETSRTVTVACSAKGSACMTSAGRGLPKSPCRATVTKSPRRTQGPRQPSTSAKAASMNAINSGSAKSAAATKRDCRRHSSAKPGRRVSGTQICTGRRPV